MEEDQNLPYYFVVLSVQLQCKKPKDTSSTIDLNTVKMTSTHEILIIPFPALLEVWKNQFDNYDIWKKPDLYTKWINLLTVGPFIGHRNAQVFEKGWTNIARGLTTKIIKIQALVREYNRELDQQMLEYRKSRTNIGNDVNSPRVKIYITPLKKDEHFTLASSTVYTPETIFNGTELPNKNRY
jgi:hypothetical protein